MSNKNTSSDPRIKRTLQAISQAIISLMDEKGFDQTTVRDITIRADINRATFYLHYKDKYDLLEKVVDERIEEFSTSFQLPEGFEVDDFIKNADTPPHSFIRQFEHIASHSHFYKVMLGINGLPSLSKRMETIIRDSLYHRSIIAQPHDNQVMVPRDIVVRYVTSAHLGVIMHWLEHDMPYTPKYMATQLIRLHMIGATNLFVPK